MSQTEVTMHLLHMMRLHYGMRPLCPDARLAEDLGMDPVSIEKLRYAVEGEFDTEIPKSTMPHLKSVRHIVAHLFREHMFDEMRSEGEVTVFVAKQ